MAEGGATWENSLNGQVVSLTIEHASRSVNVGEVLYQRVPAV